MSLNAALPGQPFPFVDAQRLITIPWYNALIRIANDVTNAIEALGAITGGALYTNGSYANVPLIGGSGNGATANIKVAGGSVTVATLVDSGVRYEVGDALSANASSIGGTGSGFSVHVTAVGTLSVDLPGQPYPIVDADRKITDPWYSSIIRIGNEVVGLGHDPAIPGRPYPLVDENRRITEPWYNALVVIANDLI
jgi:hypothetical protein